MTAKALGSWKFTIADRNRFFASALRGGIRCLRRPRIEGNRLTRGQNHAIARTSMKKVRSSQSASAGIRFLIVLTLCLSGFCLAATAFASWNGLSVVRWITSQKQSLLQKKLFLKNSNHAAAAPTKATALKSNSAGGGTAQTPPFK